MTTDSDQLLRDRFAGVAPHLGAPDWPDVLQRALRLTEPARPRTRRRVLLVAAALLAALALAGAALALTGVTSLVSTGVPAIDRLLERASSHPEPAPVGAPAYPDVHAQAGSVSEPLEVVFDDVRYTAVGFRSEAGLICSALVDPASERAQGGIGCAGERSLRRGLDERSFFVSGGGGGGHMIANGFARADAVSMSLASGGDRAVIELSKPWRPLTRAPIRFFYVITDAPAKVRPRSPLLPPAIRIEARLADGRVIRGLR